MKTLILGDIHCFWSLVNSLIEKLRPDLILQLGDFGYFPKSDDLYDPCKHLVLGKSVVRFIDGNHEDHDALSKFRGENPTAHELCPGLFYQERGSFLDLPDGRRVLFIGGADSIDKDQRTQGFDWFPEEIITGEDLARLPHGKVDIVCSHTSPSRFGVRESYIKRQGGFTDYEKDPSEDALDYAFERYRPKLWFFAHWHAKMSGETDGCRWYGLDCAGGHRYSYLWLGDLED